MVRRTCVVAAITVVCGVAGCGEDAADPAADAGAATECGSGAVVDDRPLRIAVTVAPITNLVANIVGGTDTEVVGIVPEGSDSHTFEPTPSVVAAVERADVVFTNGLMLEEPTARLARANLTAGAEVCELGTTVLPESGYRYDESFPESGGAPNPHLWTNPPMAADYADLVLDVVSARDPDDAEVYRTNHAALVERIDALDAAVREATDSIDPDDRLLLTYHDAYAYFAEEYGWTVLGAVQPSSFDEPSSRDVARLIDQVRDTGVAAVFGSEVYPSPVLEQISDATGARYVDDLRDDDLPGEPGESEHTWLAMMQFNLTTMVEALGGDAAALRALDVSDVAPDTAVYPQ